MQLRIICKELAVYSCKMKIFQHGEVFRNSCVLCVTLSVLFIYLKQFFGLNTIEREKTWASEINVKKNKTKQKLCEVPNVKRGYKWIKKYNVSFVFLHLVHVYLTVILSSSDQELLEDIMIDSSFYLSKPVVSVKRENSSTLCHYMRHVFRDGLEMFR